MLGSVAGSGGKGDPPFRGDEDLYNNRPQSYLSESEEEDPDAIEAKQIIDRLYKNNALLLRRLVSTLDVKLRLCSKGRKFASIWDKEPVNKNAISERADNRSDASSPDSFVSAAGSSNNISLEVQSTLPVTTSEISTSVIPSLIPLGSVANTTQHQPISVTAPSQQFPSVPPIPVPPPPEHSRSRFVRQPLRTGGVRPPFRFPINSQPRQQVQATATNRGGPIVSSVVGSFTPNVTSGMSRDKDSSEPLASSSKNYVARPHPDQLETSPGVECKYCHRIGHMLKDCVRHREMKEAENRPVQQKKKKKPSKRTRERSSSKEKRKTSKKHKKKSKKAMHADAHSSSDSDSSTSGSGSGSESNSEDETAHVALVQHVG